MRIIPEQICIVWTKIKIFETYLQTVMRRRAVSFAPDKVNRFCIFILCRYLHKNFLNTFQIFLVILGLHSHVQHTRTVSSTNTPQATPSPHHCAQHRETKSPTANREKLTVTTRVLPTSRACASITPRSLLWRHCCDVGAACKWARMFRLHHYLCPTSRLTVPKATGENSLLSLSLSVLTRNSAASPAIYVACKKISGTGCGWEQSGGASRCCVWLMVFFSFLRNYVT